MDKIVALGLDVETPIGTTDPGVGAERADELADAESGAVGT